MLKYIFTPKLVTVVKFRRLQRERQINTPSKTKLYMFQLHGDCPCRGGTGTPLQPGPTPAYQASQQYKTDQNVVSCGWKKGYGICVVCQRWQSLYCEDNNHWVKEICCFVFITDLCTIRKHPYTCPHSMIASASNYFQYATHIIFWNNDNKYQTTG